MLATNRAGMLELDSNLPQTRMSMTDLPIRTRIRLARDAYDQPDATWLVTVGALDRLSKPFANPTLATDVVATIDRYVARIGLTIFAGCLMPDHLHLVIGTHGQNLIDAISAIKSITTRDWWRHGGTKEVWQRSFHDEGLRSPEAFERAVTYVLENPVTAGLAASWDEYPYRLVAV
jgi:REP element-mobilizing transposase RayT